MIRNIKLWTIGAFLIGATTPDARAQPSDASAPQTAPPMSAGRAVIEAQLHAADAKKPGGNVGVEEADTIYRRYLTDIGKPVTHSGTAGYQASAPTGSGGH